MKKVLTLLVLLAVSVSFAQEDSEEPEDLNTGLPPGVTITIYDPTEDLELEVAQELYLNPTSLEAEIPFDGTTAFLIITLTSRVPTEVEVRANHPNLMVVGDPTVRMGPGSRIAVSFTAFSAHSGTIEFVNTEGEVIATVDYVVTKADPYRESVSASADTAGNISASYSISHRFGCGGSINAGYSVENDDFSAGLSVSCSW